MDIISFEILENGDLKVKTDEISSANHTSADKLLKNMEELMGGKVTRTKDPDAQNKIHRHHGEKAHQH
jgi:hypothetical protein